MAHAPAWTTQALPDFTSRLRWLQRRRPELLDGLLTHTDRTGEPADALLALLDQDRLVRVLQRFFDEGEFFSDFGIRSLSRVYTTTYNGDGGRAERVDRLRAGGIAHRPVRGQLTTGAGPIWFPVNVLLGDALRTYGEYFGDNPAGRGAHRLRHPDDAVPGRGRARLAPGRSVPSRPGRARRPSDGARIEASDNPLWRAHVTFSEYFHGDSGEGLGASHQTGWTALVAHLLCSPIPAPVSRGA